MISRRGLLMWKVSLFLGTISSGWPVLSPAAPPGGALSALEQSLIEEGAQALARAARTAGDPKRGAVLFHRANLACATCHVADAQGAFFGPDLSRPAKETTDVSLVESVLEPSRVIRKEFETVSVITADGKKHIGLVTRETDAELVLRDGPQAGNAVHIPKGDIEERTTIPQSIMPAGLINQLSGRRQFLDLVCYLIDIAEKGPERALELRPPADVNAPPRSPSARSRVIDMVDDAFIDRMIGGGPLNPDARIIPKGDIAIELQDVASGFKVPLVLTHAPGQSDRLYIVDQPGNIRIVDHGRMLDNPFLDVGPWLIALKPDYDERGLLGLAFHPQFNNQKHGGYRKLYTFTSEPPGPCEFALPDPNAFVDHINVVTEWRVRKDDVNRVDVASRRVVLSYATRQFHHNGGCLAFGPDGLLYISCGDGGDTLITFPPGKPPTGNGQDVECPMGKILRIDPLGEAPVKAKSGQYSVPADNPYVGRPGLDAIYAIGFRNPWRMSFDRVTGDLVEGDVGQAMQEEINIVRRGGNYGWPIKEGNNFFDGNLGKLSRNVPWAAETCIVDPVATYDRDYGVVSITGGFVYRGAAIPRLQGLYVFGDWSLPGGGRGRLFFADLRTGKIQQFILGPSDRLLDGYVVAFGEDTEGEIYVLTTDAAGPKGASGRARRVIAYHGELQLKAPQPTRPTGPPAGEGDIVARGRQLFTLKLCASCHQIDPNVPAVAGIAIKAPGFIGKFWGQPREVHEGINGPVVTVDFDEAYFIESTKLPMKKVVKGSLPAMAPLPMTDDEVNAIAAYVKSLSE
ncbi:MAG: PQQ-dependent sugar dehydrogenase [Planctomycetaceae bacterium]